MGTAVSPGEIPEKNGIRIDIVLVHLPLVRKELPLPFQEFIVFPGLPEEGEGGREDYVASAARLRALDPVRVHFVHDPAIWERGR